MILAHISDYEHGANGTSSTSYSPRLLLAILEPSVGPPYANREDEVEILIERGGIGSARHPRVFLAEDWAVSGLRYYAREDQTTHNSDLLGPVRDGSWEPASFPEAQLVEL